jgi:porin
MARTPIFRSRIGSPLLALAACAISVAAARAQQAAPVGADLTQIDAGPQASNHIFGDMNGFRPWLNDKGITYTLDFTSEAAYNASGGLRDGGGNAYQAGLSVDVDWQKLAGINGFSTHTILINRGGVNVSAADVGDNVLQAQEIYGAGFNTPVKLVWFYGEEKLLDDRVDLAFGRMAPGTDFNASPLYCNFMTLTICGHDRALTANQGFEDWPMSEWGGRIRVQTTDQQYYAMVGVFQSQPFPSTAEPYTQGGYNGWDWTGKGTTGVSIPIEVGYQPVIGGDHLPGHYKLGFNWDTSTYPDNYIDATGTPIALSGQPGQPHDGRAQFWASADQMVFRNGPGANDGLILLAAYAHDDTATSFFNNFVWGGFIDRGFWSARPNDQIAFAASWYDVSQGVTRTEQLQSALGMPLEGGALGVQSYAEVLELNYGIQVTPAILVQPELEYFARPGGTSAVPNAFLVGLKFHADF